MRRSLTWAVLIGGLFLFPVTAAANMAPPWQPGDAVGEPQGELSEMHIEHEQLTFDLRPLALGDPALVSATYQVRNDGETKDVDLVFVATGLAHGTTGVWLDGVPIDFERGDGSGSSYEPPPGISWRPPSTTPGLDGDRLQYEARFDGVLRFSLPVEPGSHDIVVSYPALATAYSGDSPARYWQLGYVLAPAREWASFGTLDVAVTLPPGWSLASEPALQRTGDDAAGSFQGVPADALAITAQMPVIAPGFNPWPAVVLVVGVFAGLLVAMLGGSRLAGRGRSAISFLPVSLIWSVLTGIAILAVGVVTASGPQVPEIQRSWGYGSAFTDGLANVLWLIVAAALTGVLLTLAMQLVVALMIGRARRSTLST